MSIIGRITVWGRILPIIMVFSMAVEIMAQRVGLREHRETTLELAQQILHPEDPDFQIRVAATVNPFIGVIEETPRPTPTQLETEEEPDIQPDRLPAERALRLIADSFHPRGAIVRGEQRYVMLPGGRTMEEGSSFSARIGEFQYEVTLRDITTTRYTLELEQARLRREYGAQTQEENQQAITPGEDQNGDGSAP